MINLSHVWREYEHNIYSLASTLARSGSRFLLLWLASLMLAESQFGQLNVFLVLYFFARVCSDGFVHMPYIKFLSESDANQSKLNTHALVLKLVLIILVCGMFSILQPLLSQKFGIPAKALLLLLPLLLLSFGLFAFFTQFLNATLRYRYLFIFEFFQCFALVLVGCGLYFHSGIDGYQDIVILMIFAFSLSVLFGVIFIGRLIQFDISFDWDVVRKLLNYGKYSVITAVGATLFLKADILMIAHFMTAEDVAIYAIAVLIVELINVILDSFQKVALPASSALKKSPTSAIALRKLYADLSKKAYLTTSVAVVIVCVFALFGIEYIYGERYRSATLPLIVLALGSLLKPQGYISGTMLSGIGMAKLDNRNCWLTAFVNIGLNTVFIPLMGILGAALTTLISNAIYTYLQHRSLKAVLAS